MKYYILLIIVILLSGLNLIGQIEEDARIKILFQSKQYDELINHFSSDISKLSANSLYFLGQAYHVKEDDENCISLMNLSIAKDSTDSRPFYTRAMSFKFIEKNDEAISSMLNAINLNPNEGQYYASLGIIYFELGKHDYSIIALTKAKSLLDNKSNGYIDVLFNLGLAESLSGNYNKAEEVFLELIELDTNFFHGIAKLIQVYYHNKEYAKAKPYKEKLYAAHSKGLLNDHLSDMFCFDQFRWQDKLIQVFERFQEGGTEIYNKHLFYVVNDSEEIELRIQTEYSPIMAKDGVAKYILCQNYGSKHSTFNISFADDFNYDDLKESVLDILEGRIKPTATSSPSK